MAWLREKRPIFAFVGKFGALVILLYILLALPGPEQFLYHYLQANAWLANLVLDLLGEGTRVHDVTVQSPDFAIRIQRGCDAIEPTWLLCAAILAFPASFPMKAMGMAAGIVVLQVLNVVRIITLYLIGRHLPAFFSPAHVEIWPVVFILVAIALFCAWKGWLSEKR